MKTDTSPLRLDALPADARALLPKVANEVPSGVLGGGTAIALQLGHRRSYDLDLFVSKKVPPRLLHQLQAAAGRATPLIDTPEELTCRIGGTKVSIVWFPFAPLHSLVQSSVGPLFDLRDLASNKAYAIGRRGVWRDYVDIFALLKYGLTLKEIIRGAEKRFGDAFNAKLFLEQLTYYGDIEDLAVEWLWAFSPPQAVQTALQKAAADFLRVS